MKKLALVLLAAMLIPTFAACSDAADSGSTDTTAADASGETTSAETTTVDPNKDDLPDLDYEGYEFKISSRYAPNYFGYTVSTPEETGDVVNDAIYARDRAIEERLNIKLTEKNYDNATQGQEVPKTLIMAGDDTYDLFVARNVQSFTWAAEGLIVDWAQLDYVDLDKPYWYQTINENFVLNGKIFFAAGAFNLTANEFTHTLLFNKQLNKSLNLDNPYELVLDGSWTYDEFSKMAKAAVSDLNGDGVMNTNDRYGLLSIPKQVLPGFWIAAGIQTIERDTDGKFVYSTPENERFITVYNRVIADMYDDKAWMITPPSGADSNKEPDYFSEGKGLFLNANFYRISTLRAMETDFGILPYPKWEESQGEYLSRIEGCELPIVPMTNKDLSRTGAVLEALSSESVDTVVTAYYDKALTGKYARDEESLEMLEIIMANRIFDYGDTILCSQIRDGVLRSAYESNNRDIVSALVANTGSVKAQLDILNRDY
nr:hypothetical protein [Clostridia bacterium]